MKLSNRIFVAILVPSLAAAAVVARTTYGVFSEQLEAWFYDFHESASKSVLDTLTQLDQETDKNLKNVAQLILKDERAFDRHTDDELRELAAKWNVSHLFTIEAKSGRFIKSSCEPPDELPSLYYYCSDYRDLATGAKSFELTPLIHGEPEHEAYKFLLFPSADRTKIYEIATHARFLGRTLRTAVASHDSIVSVGLFAPNGDSLGYFGRTTEVGRVEKLSVPAGYPHAEQDDEQMTIYNLVPASVQNCCECRKHLKNVGDGDFNYVLRVEISKTELNSVLRRVAQLLWLLQFVMGVGIFAVSRVLAATLTRRLSGLNNQMARIRASGQIEERVATRGDDEITRLGESFNDMLDSLQKYQNDAVSAERQETFISLAAQVSHDIRSPLTALQSAALKLPDIPEQERVQIRCSLNRILDIANQLLQKSRDLRSLSHIGDASPCAAPQLISSLVETIVSEKRVQCRGNTNIEIELHLDAESYGVFAEVDDVSFGRVLSNIMANAIEGLTNQLGSVAVSINATSNHVEIIVRDDGCGIPQDVLQRLENDERLTTKKDGNGLGLSNAKMSVVAWGGSLSISSVVGHGTSVTIHLPRCHPPAWFVEKLVVPPDVIVVDDDRSIHDVWRGRLSEGHLNCRSILHFSSSQELFAWSKRENQIDHLYLVDYELIGDRYNGLDIIEQLGIAAQSVLVTSHYDEAEVRSRCESLGVKLLPKSLATVVPLVARTAVAVEPYDVVQIDDDPIVRMMWNMEAKRHGDRLLSLASFGAFRAHLAAVAPSTPMYVDFELNDPGCSGFDVSKSLFGMGFANIFISTGRAPDDLPPMPHVKGIRGKEYPESATATMGRPATTLKTEGDLANRRPTSS